MSSMSAAHPLDSSAAPETPGAGGVVAAQIDRSYPNQRSLDVEMFGSPVPHTRGAVRVVGPGRRTRAAGVRAAGRLFRLRVLDQPGHPVAAPGRAPMTPAGCRTGDDGDGAFHPRPSHPVVPFRRRVGPVPTELARRGALWQKDPTMWLHIGQSALYGDISRYAQRFNLLELRAEPGRLPKPATLKRWLSAVPEGFRFSGDAAPRRRVACARRSAGVGARLRAPKRARARRSLAGAPDAIVGDARSALSGTLAELVERLAGLVADRLGAPRRVGRRRSGAAREVPRGAPGPRSHPARAARRRRAVHPPAGSRRSRRAPRSGRRSARRASGRSAPRPGWWSRAGAQCGQCRCCAS